MEEKFYSVYDLIATHRDRWVRKENGAKDSRDYNLAQSYRDMAYAANVLLYELEQNGLLRNEL